MKIFLNLNKFDETDGRFILQKLYKSTTTYAQNSYTIFLQYHIDLLLFLIELYLTTFPRLHYFKKRVFKPHKNK